MQAIGSVVAQSEPVETVQRGSVTIGLPWRGFTGEDWQRQVRVSEFILANYTPYEGTAAFLVGPTDRTKALFAKLESLLKLERDKGVLDVSTDRGTSITAHAPGYIDRNLERIVGLQTDMPLKRAIVPNGGVRMVEAGLAAYGFALSPQVADAYTHYRKDHNRGVFDVYTSDILAARKAGIITGLPDAYGRGRIIGDYRRVALYGVAFLITDKKRERAELDRMEFTEDVIRLREELSEQIRALDELRTMAQSYGYDISGPAATAQEPLQ